MSYTPQNSFERVSFDIHIGKDERIYTGKDFIIRTPTSITRCSQQIGKYEFVKGGCAGS